MIAEFTHEEPSYGIGMFVHHFRLGEFRIRSGADKSWHELTQDEKNFYLESTTTSLIFMNKSLTTEQVDDALIEMYEYFDRTKDSVA